MPDKTPNTFRLDQQSKDKTQDLPLRPLWQLNVQEMIPKSKLLLNL